MKAYGKLATFAMSLLAALSMNSCGLCTKDNKNISNANQDVEAEHICEHFVGVVLFVPLDGVSATDAEKLADDFYTNYSGYGEIFDVGVLSHRKSPKSCLNDAKTRFSGTKLMGYVRDSTAKERTAYLDSLHVSSDIPWYIIGVTDKDISTAAHGKKDYGILGLSYLGKGNCSIISTYRLKRKKDLWKLAVHEFCHGFYGCPHCKADDPKCLMQDAKGGNPHFESKTSLCPDCAKICTIK